MVFPPLDRHFFSPYFFSSQEDETFSLSLSVFVTFCLLSSRRRQQHPKRRRRATAEPRETLSLSPFSFSPRRAERVVGKSSSSSNSSRHRSIMVDEQRTTDNDRENAEGDDDGATAPVPEKVTLLLKHHRFSAFDKTTKRESRVCFRRSSSKVARKRKRVLCVPSRGMPFEI